MLCTGAVVVEVRIHHGCGSLLLALLSPPKINNDNNYDDDQQNQSGEATSTAYHIVTVFITVEPRHFVFQVTDGKRVRTHFQLHTNAQTRTRTLLNIYKGE